MKALNEGKANTSAASFSRVSVQRLRAPSLGAKSEAYRFQGRVKTMAEGEAPFYIDIVYVNAGRALLTLQAAQVGQPFDRVEFQGYLLNALERIARLSDGP